MRTLFYTLLLLFTASVSSLAQRTADLRTTLITPADGTVVPSGQAFNIRISVKNIGTTTLNQGDSIAVYLVHDADTIPVLLQGGGTSMYEPTATGILKPGDSVILSKTSSFNYSTVNDTINLCLIAMPRSGDATTINELTVTDNRACAKMYATGHPTSVGTTPSPVEEFSVYPVPATSVVVFAFAVPPTVEAEIEMLDIQGRRVYHAPPQKMPAGPHELRVDVSGFPNGMYMYRARYFNKVQMGRFMVAH